MILVGRRGNLSAGLISLANTYWDHSMRAECKQSQFYASFPETSTFIKDHGPWRGYFFFTCQTNAMKSVNT